MHRTPVRIAAYLIITTAVVAWARPDTITRVREFVELFHGTPHQRYAAGLRWRGDAEGRAWLDASRTALDTASALRLPASQRISFRADRPEARAFLVPVRRGQRYVVTKAGGTVTSADVFIDLFERTGATFSRVASTTTDASGLAIDVDADADYVVRVQPALGSEVELTLDMRTEPTLRLPVARAASSNIQSFFGAPRDGGRRDHHGVDIFARRGTPVVAAADGIVSSVGRNGLGGNVVWVARPLHGERHYYAHLDRQLVIPGTIVKAGDVIGTVGNTGNARTTAPHLHFGIYALGEGAVDPLPYLTAPRPHKPRG